MDTQTAPFPLQVQRDIGKGATVNEIQPKDYPFFVDIRNTGMDKDSPIIARLPSITLNWASPLTIDAALTKNLKVSKVLQSSPNAWITDSTNANPDYTTYPDSGFPPGMNPGTQTLAVSLEGSFTSFFKGKPLPIGAQPTPAAGTQAQPTPSGQPVNANFVSQSPSTARLVVVGSSEFLNDNVLQLASQLGGESVLNNLQFVQNTVEWFTEDTALSTIRAKGTGTRLLAPLKDEEKSRWEVFNYAFALISLLILGVIWQLRRRSEKPMKLIASAAEDVRTVAAPQGGLS